MKHMDAVEKSLFIFVVLVGIFGVGVFSALFATFWGTLTLFDIVFGLGLVTVIEGSVVILLVAAWKTTRK